MLLCVCGETYLLDVGRVLPAASCCFKDVQQKAGGRFYLILLFIVLYEYKEYLISAQQTIHKTCFLCYIL